MIDSKSFRGSYLLYRKAGKAMGSVKRCRGGVAPRFRHPDRASAEAEAQRLLGIFPSSTFIVLQEVGRIKVKDADETVKCRRAGCQRPTSHPSGMCEEHQPGFAQVAA